MVIGSSPQIYYCIILIDKSPCTYSQWGWNFLCLFRFHNTYVLWNQEKTKKFRIPATDGCSVTPHLPASELHIFRTEHHISCYSSRMKYKLLNIKIRNHTIKTDFNDIWMEKITSEWNKTVWCVKFIHQYYWADTMVPTLKANTVKPVMRPPSPIREQPPMGDHLLPAAALFDIFR